MCRTCYGRVQKRGPEPWSGRGPRGPCKTRKTWHPPTFSSLFRGRGGCGTKEGGTWYLAGTTSVPHLLQVGHVGPVPHSSAHCPHLAPSVHRGVCVNVSALTVRACVTSVCRKVGLMTNLTPPCPLYSRAKPHSVHLPVNVLLSAELLIM